MDNTMHNQMLALCPLADWQSLPARQCGSLEEDPPPAQLGLVPAFCCCAQPTSWLSPRSLIQPCLRLYLFSVGCILLPCSFFLPCLPSPSCCQLCYNPNAAPTAPLKIQCGRQSKRLAALLQAEQKALVAQAHTGLQKTLAAGHQNMTAHQHAPARSDCPGWAPPICNCICHAALSRSPNSS